MRLLEARAWLAPLLALAACASAPAGEEAGYRWTRLAEAAPFPGSYGFPVHAAPDGRFVALHPKGSWSTRDGATWVKEPLPPSGTNHAYLPHVAHDGASWALGAVEGNYERFAIDPVIRRTRDYRTWETLGRSETLPRMIFAATISFKDAIWLFGGYDGKAATNSVWRSADGLAWERVTEHAPWSPRSRASAVVFRDRLWLIGGGTIDGPVRSEVWSSPDGAKWTREAERIAEPEPFGFAAQVFDGRLWLVGANRSGGFSSEMLVSDDGRAWRAVRAPWSPRGGVATWTDGRRMYLTGGKYSRDAGGEHIFIYSNDVWAMETSARP